MKLSRLLPLACCAIAACQPAAQDVDLESPQQRGSYAQGVSQGRQAQALPLDVDAFVQGIRDGISNEERLTDEQIEEAVIEFRSLVSDPRGAAGEENRRAGEAFLEQNWQRAGVQVTGSGLQYEVLEEGDGPRPAATDVVRVHYRGTMIDGSVFDESYSRGEPATFPLNEVIPGWTEGVQLMPVGSKYKLYVPSNLGYGENVPPGARFGPNATLIFEVELLEIVER